jgi:hypothetical protein
METGKEFYGTETESFSWKWKWNSVFLGGWNGTVFFKVEQPRKQNLHSWLVRNFRFKIVLHSLAGTICSNWHAQAILPLLTITRSNCAGLESKLVLPALKAGPFVEDKKSISNPYIVLPWTDCIYWANIGSINICFSRVPKASITSLSIGQKQAWRRYIYDILYFS